MHETEVSTSESTELVQLGRKTPSPGANHETKAVQAEDELPDCEVISLGASSYAKMLAIC